jgi:hypothetical protein
MQGNLGKVTFTLDAAGSTAFAVGTVARLWP